MYAIISGELEVIDPIDDPEATDPGCVDVIIRRCDVGDVVGEMGLLRSARRSATVVGKRSGELLKINMKMIKRLQWLYPPTAHRFFFNMMNILCDRLESATDCMAQLSLEDDLTHLCNRRGFAKILEAETYRSQRFSEPLALMVMTVDFTGSGQKLDLESQDRLLRRICSRLFSNIRRCDTFGRLDQRTFALLMPRTSQTKTQMVQQRLQALLDEERFETDGIQAKAALKIIDLSGKESLTASQLLEQLLIRLPQGPDGQNPTPA
jgi:diguanylate cyclase (GGDEF)-like protein